MMSGKWTTVLAAAAFVLSVFAVTPVGNSAKDLIAPNADKVDGIRASRTPKAGNLLPLGKDGKFPASVLPTVTGPQGPAGPIGPAGQQGQKGDTGATGAQGPKGDTGAAGTSAAVTGTGAEKITACRNETNGLLRVVTEASDCRTHESAISWDVQGPAGPQGPPGEQGPPGPAGSGGGALAYAHVLGGGTIDAGRSKNVLSLTNTIIPGSNPGIPVFCFDLSVTAENIVATVENSVENVPPMGPGIGSFPVNATVDPAVAQGFGCAVGTDAAVVGMRGSGSVRQPFYVLFN